MSEPLCQDFLGHDIYTGDLVIIHNRKYGNPNYNEPSPLVLARALGFYEDWEAKFLDVEPKRQVRLELIPDTIYQDRMMPSELVFYSAEYRDMPSSHIAEIFQNKVTS